MTQKENGLKREFEQNEMTIMTIECKGLTLWWFIQANPADFQCPLVLWRPLDFKPNDYLGQCASINPIFGFMMRIWSRSKWTKDLEIAHAPFIDAVRNICLSPFFILLAGALLYLSASLMVDLFEWILIRAGMIKTRKFIEVFPFSYLFLFCSVKASVRLSTPFISFTLPHVTDENIENERKKKRDKGLRL